MNSPRVLRVAMTWGVVALVFGALAIAHSSLLQMFGYWVFVALVVVAGTMTWRERLELSRFVALICTSRGLIALVTPTGKVTGAQATGRNVRLPGFWLIEVRARTRHIVIVDLKNSTRWEVAMLRRRLQAGAAEEPIESLT